jgi:hypothetical protein
LNNSLVLGNLAAYRLLRDGSLEKEFRMNFSISEENNQNFSYRSVWCNSVQKRPQFRIKLTAIFAQADAEILKNAKSGIPRDLITFCEFCKISPRERKIVLKKCARGRCDDLKFTRQLFLRMKDFCYFMHRIHFIFISISCCLTVLMKMKNKKLDQFAYCTRE